MDFEPKRRKLGKNVREMDEELIRRFNARVSPNDRALILGDFAFSSSGYAKSIVSRLNGTKILVVGNHDKHTAHHMMGWGFDWVCYEMTMKIAGKFVRLSHYPYQKPWYKAFFPWQHKEKDRHKRPVDRGQWLLHGHIHSGGHRVDDGAWRLRGQQINIGVDVWDYYPVGLDKIEQIIQQSAT
jgi:calcineurin-like phosphoesterase family protein